MQKSDSTTDSTHSKVLPEYGSRLTYGNTRRFTAVRLQTSDSIVASKILLVTIDQKQISDNRMSRIDGVVRCLPEGLFRGRQSESSIQSVSVCFDSATKGDCDVIIVLRANL